MLDRRRKTNFVSDGVVVNACDNEVENSDEIFRALLVDWFQLGPILADSGTPCRRGTNPT